MSIPIAERPDRLQGYRGPTAEVLDSFQVGVWSEVEVTNDEGSVFAGVILPRNETCDDLHVVIKLFNGYNVGVAAHRIVQAVETGYRKAVYKNPREGLPVRSAQEERHPARHGRDHREPPRLPDRCGHPGVHAR